MASFLITNTTNTNLDLGNGVAIGPGESVILGQITEHVEKNRRVGYVLVQEVAVVEGDDDTKPDLIGVRIPYATTDTDGLVRFGSQVQHRDGVGVGKAVSTAGLLDAVQGPGAVREAIKLAAKPTDVPVMQYNIYVRLDGNDANDGLEDTPSRAFRTITQAMNVALSLQNRNVLRPSIYGTVGRSVVCINIAAGDYSGETLFIELAGAVDIWLYGAGTGNTIIPALRSYATGRLLVENVSIKTSADAVFCVAIWGGTLYAEFNDVRFINNYAIDGGSYYSCLYVDGTHNVILFKVTIEGHWTSFAESNHNHCISLLGRVTLTNTPTFTDAFYVSDAGQFNYLPHLGVVGAATGVKFKVNSTAVLNTYGSVGGNLPGNAAGVATGTHTIVL